MNSSEEEQLIQLLDKCTPGNLPQQVFEAVGRVSVYPAVEIIPVRITQRGVEVLLLRRPADDIAWPSMMHTPGTIHRPTDENVEMGIVRVLGEELHNTTLIGEPKFIRTSMYNHKRGRGLGLGYIIEVSDSIDGDFYSMSAHPDNVIREQVPTIKYIAGVYNEMLLHGENSA